VIFSQKETVVFLDASHHQGLLGTAALRILIAYLGGLGRGRYQLIFLSFPINVLLVVGQHLQVVLHYVFFLWKSFWQELFEDPGAVTLLFSRVRVATPFLVLGTLELISVDLFGAVSDLVVEGVE